MQFMKSLHFQLHISTIGIRIVTDSEKFAGTPDTDIYVSLVGSKACTEDCDTTI